ncbi:hypothetical protein J2R76_003731 [Bradyrhizobium sp. USDA 4532]|uniref:hypothetical protein n=1 Tax=unclassified Bradyrhizobium TaxID=2631580 RepID=UPI00209ECE2F|nr:MULTISPECIES: hypothetical protein [unclassified Bradyrhizobium]MCP1835394.1 hypothetical protein [Bradyrhizobium sp. USDA 4545]MCP1920140.1 hypothetical protein [Bradyrhizobium sp. USDA 4532]
MSDSSTGSNQWPRPYRVDTQLYDDFWNWLAAKLPRRRSYGAALAAGDMYDFLAWIRETNRPPMADRIAQSSLDADVQAYAADYIGRDVPLMGGFRDRLLNLRDMLRDLQFENWARGRNLMFQAFEGARPSSSGSSSSHTTNSGSTHTADSSISNPGPGPHDVDLRLYEAFWNWLTEKLPSSRSRGADHAADDMSDFLKWIRETNRPPMADRIALPSLDTDIQAYVRDYIGRDAPTIGGFRNRLLNLRDMLRDFHRAQFENWAHARGAMFQGFEIGGPSSAPLAPTMPSDGPMLAAGAEANSVRRDFGAYVLPGWSGGVAPDPLIAELRESGLLPGSLRPQSVLINGMRYAAVLRPGRAPVTPNNPQGENFVLTPGYPELGLPPHPRVDPINQIGPLLDIGESVGRDWIHGPRVADRSLISVLSEFGLLPTHRVPMTLFHIHRERYTAESGPDGRILVIHRPQAG